MTRLKIQTHSCSLKTEEYADSQLTYLLTPLEVAHRLRVSIKTIYRLSLRGEIPSIKIGGRYRYRASQIDQWLKGGNES